MGSSVLIVKLVLVQSSGNLFHPKDSARLRHSATVPITPKGVVRMIPQGFETVLPYLKVRQQLSLNIKSE
jgi:hypothetical protein